VKRVFEVPRGSVDGTNRTFVVSRGYMVKSTAVFLNGFTLRKEWENGWVEAAPYTVILKEAPIPGDDIQVQYVVAS